MKKSLSVKRSELKYFINHLNYTELVNRLQHVLSHDPHSLPFQGYRIRSLYFDSIDDECLADKQSGYIYRKKYRLRLYDTNTDSVKFEIKHKLNSQIFKESVLISKTMALEIIEGNYGVLMETDNKILNRIYTEFTNKCYHPKVMVEYIRDAFVYDLFNTRITIDKDLRTSNSNFDLFSNDIHLIPVLDTQKHILEIKFDQVLADFILNLLQVSRFERMAISKYTLSRRLNKFKQWEDN